MGKRTLSNSQLCTIKITYGKSGVCLKSTDNIQLAYRSAPVSKKYEHKKQNDMVKIELLTKADLEDLKNEIVQEIKQLITPASAPVRQWLKSVEVRRMLNISPGTLQNMRINGTLPYTKVGSIMYYRYEDIVKLLEGTPNGKP